MDVNIKRHRVPEEEFRQLKNLYFMGEYEKENETEWFTVRIDMSTPGYYQNLVITWFKEWKV